MEQHIDEGYRTLGTRLYQDTLPIIMEAKLISHIGEFTIRSEWEISLWDTETQTYVYKGDLRETQEAILLGKLALEELKTKAQPLEYKGLDQLSEADRNEIESVCELEKVKHNS